MSCRLLALNILADAITDVEGRDCTTLTASTAPHRDTNKGEGKRLKDNALAFLFSKKSEPYYSFWCEVANVPMYKFRNRGKKYRKNGDKICKK